MTGKPRTDAGHAAGYTRRERRRSNNHAANLLRHHGDAEVAEGLIDLAVNIRRKVPPVWLQEAILDGLKDIGRYPNAEEATSAVAEFHGLDNSNVLLTNGATEAFSLICNAFPPEVIGKVAVVHPQFSEPERAAIAAGHVVEHAMCRVENGFKLDPTSISDEAGLVFVGNPTNPTGVLHPAQMILSLLRPDRIVVVDEAFMDTIPDEKQSVVTANLPGLLVIRSLTKTWALAGLRLGYIVGDPDLLSAVAGQQPPWSVNNLALRAAQACTSVQARRALETGAEALQSETSLLTSALGLIASEYHGVYLPGTSSAPFVLFKVAYGEARRFQMRNKGWAIRGCGSFPGLSEDWWRIAVRDTETTVRFLTDFKSILAPQHQPPPTG